MVDNLGELDTGRNSDASIDEYSWNEKVDESASQLLELASSLGTGQYLLSKETSMKEADRKTDRKATEQKLSGIPKYKLFMPTYSAGVYRLCTAFDQDQPLSHYYRWRLAWNAGEEPRFDHRGRMIYCGFRVFIEAHLTPDRLLRVRSKEIFGIKLTDQLGTINRVLDMAYSNPYPYERL